MKDIGKLLQKVDTRDGKARLVKKLSIKHQIPKAYLHDAIDFFEEKGSEFANTLVEVAEFAKKVGIPKRAEEIYNRAIKMTEEKGFINYAARIAKGAGMFERAKKLFIRDLELNVEKGKFYLAAKSAEQAEMPEKAKELFIKAVENYGINNGTRDCHFNNNDILKRIDEITKKAEMVNQKQQLYEQTIESYKKRWKSIPGAGHRDAARFAKIAGMHERARELTLKSIENYVGDGNYSNAIDLTENVGGIKTLEDKLKEKIILAMEENRGEVECAEFAEEIGMPEKAKELYIKAMKDCVDYASFEKAAEFAKKAGMPEKAKDYKKLHKSIEGSSILKYLSKFFH